MVVISIMATVSFTMVLILVKMRVKFQRELRETTKETSIYEDIDLHPLNTSSINTNDNVAYHNVNMAPTC